MRLVSGFAAAALLAASSAGTGARLTEKCDVDYSHGWMTLTFGEYGDGPTDSFMRLLGGGPLTSALLYRLWEPQKIVDEGDYLYLKFDSAQDTREIAATIRADPVLASFGVAGAYDERGLFCIGMPPGTLPVRVTEYYSAWRDRYMLAFSSTFPDYLRNTVVNGSIWRPTGEGWDGIWHYECTEARPVFNFLHRPTQTQHFVTSGEECGQLRKDRDWEYLGNPLGGREPVAGSCPAQTRPLFLMARETGRRVTYRHVLRPQLRDQLLAKGWRVADVPACLADDPFVSIRGR